MREPPYTIDRAHYPVIRIRWHRVVTHAEALTYFQELEALLGEKRAVTLVITLPPGLTTKTEDQLMMSNWLRDNEEALRKYVVGMCFVTSSTVLTMAFQMCSGRRSMPSKRAS